MKKDDDEEQGTSHSTIRLQSSTHFIFNLPGIFTRKPFRSAVPLPARLSLPPTVAITQHVASHLPVSLARWNHGRLKMKGCRDPLTLDRKK
ncbi:hypothetical protein E2C01_052399 [Portunus trituberculatus]|uniref:Uncharacterized protein n=1 Tax=Portunus trituberculatus TaxID=210409 RepID=A0A5B7GLS7_PORTR|nr:hypothetical protein [Portunus trituberculatus]